MPQHDLPDAYRRYIACLNDRALDQLDEFVHGQVEYNGSLIGLAGYRRARERDFLEIPDLRFNIQMLVAEGSVIAARLIFDCAPAGRFLDLDVNGRRVRFSENVFYEYEAGKIRRVWSVVDKAAIEAQLAVS